MGAVAEMIQRCWQAEPASRPSFMEIVKLLADILQVPPELPSIPTISGNMSYKV
jgi:hypothetical protein